MKSRIKAIPLCLLMVTLGCSDDGKQAKAEDTVLKTQMDALKKAKNVDSIVLDAAAKRREAIEEGAE